MSVEKVWLAPPRGEPGEPLEIEAIPELLTPYLVKGWAQCEPPEIKQSSPMPEPSEHKETGNAS